MKLKFFAVILLLYSTLSYAASVDKDHPFLKIGESNDKSTSVFIGAYGDIRPRLTNDDDIVLIAVLKADVADATHQKGQQNEYIVRANCSEKIAKILLIWRKSNESDKGVALYYNGDELLSSMNNQTAVKVDPKSLLGIVVTSGCNYLGKGVHTKKKPIEIEI
jgi:hypothetical protein